MHLPTNAADREGGATLMPHSLGTKKKYRKLVWENGAPLRTGGGPGFHTQKAFWQSFLSASHSHQRPPGIMDVKATPFLDPVVPVSGSGPRWHPLLEVP